MARLPWGHGVIRKEDEDKSIFKNCQQRLTISVYALCFFGLVHLLTTKNDTGLTDYRENNKIESRTRGSTSKKIFQDPAAATLGEVTLPEGQDEEEQQQQQRLYEDEYSDHYHEDVFEYFDDDEVKSDLNAVRGTIDDILGDLRTDAEEIMERLTKKQLYLEINEIVNDVVDEEFRDQLLNNAAGPLSKIESEDDKSEEKDALIMTQADIQTLVDDIQINVIEFCEEQMLDHISIMLENYNQTIEDLAAEGQNDNMNAIEIDQMLYDYEVEIREAFEQEIEDTIENVLNSKAVNAAYVGDITAVEEYTANNVIEVFNQKFVEMGRPDLIVQIHDYQLVSEKADAKTNADLETE